MVPYIFVHQVHQGTSRPPTPSNNLLITFFILTTGLILYKHIDIKWKNYKKIKEKGLVQITKPVIQLRDWH